MTNDERFYTPAGPTIIDTYRAFRAALERLVAKKGETLDESWYRDSPEDNPILYRDQPHLLPPGTRPSVLGGEPPKADEDNGAGSVET